MSNLPKQNAATRMFGDVISPIDAVGIAKFGPDRRNGASVFATNTCSTDRERYDRRCSYREGWEVAKSCNFVRFKMLPCFFRIAVVRNYDPLVPSPLPNNSIKS